MDSKQKTFIIAIVIAVLFVIGLGFLLNRPAPPSKYQDFAKALVTNGATFYGAFWCPHCQAQEKEFGISRQSLESMGLYKECSNADQSVTPLCKEKKIESYPTWMFKDGLTLTSTGMPTVCKANTGTTAIAGEPAACTPQMTSQYYKTWIFPDYQFSIKSPADPVQKDKVWKFPVGSETTGELPLDFIASQIGYTLPQ